MPGTRAYCVPPTAPRPGRVSQVTSKLSFNGQGGVNSPKERGIGLGRARVQRPGWARDGWTPPPSASCQGMRSSSPPFLPPSLSLLSYTRSDSSMRGAVIKRRMGSEKLEERERSSVAAKHPHSRPCYDAKFPSGAQLSVVRAQIRQGEGGGSARGPSAGRKLCIYKLRCRPSTSPSGLFLNPSQPLLSGHPAPSTPFESSFSTSQGGDSPSLPLVSGPRPAAC